MPKGGILDLKVPTGKKGVPKGRKIVPRVVVVKTCKRDVRMKAWLIEKKTVSNAEKDAPKDIKIVPRIERIGVKVVQKIEKDALRINVNNL